MLTNSLTAKFCWIPILSAIFISLFVWIGSWIMYAFGELVEDIHIMAFNERTVEQHSNDSVEQPPKITYEESTNLRKANQCDCGEMYYGLFCPVCGKRTKEQSKIQKI